MVMKLFFLRIIPLLSLVCCLNWSEAVERAPSGGAPRQTVVSSNPVLCAESKTIEGRTVEEREKRLVEKEAEFRKKPSDFNTVLDLADAYSAMGDAASAFMALSLYRGLAEASPSDFILARLADAYARLFLYDKALTVAFRRTWNPLVSPAGAVSQIVFISLASGDLDRGIGYLLSILEKRDEERESVFLALAALYAEKAGTVSDRSLRREYGTAATACLDEAERAIPESSAMVEVALRLRKGLDGR